MLRNDLIKRGFKTAAASFGLIVCATAFTQQASAGCLTYEPVKKTVSDWQTPDSSLGAARFIKAGYLQVSDGEWAPGFFHAPIVGLWDFHYTSLGNDHPPLNLKDGTPFDAGNTLWFADGNELTYSSMRAPTIGATCLGVWKQTGERTYELNHIGQSWDPTPTTANPLGVPAGPAFIKQYVTLDRGGDKYSGNFKITLLAPDGVTPLGLTITGLITATRLTVDSITNP
jgi:hypothetical protein